MLNFMILRNRFVSGLTLAVGFVVVSWQADRGLGAAWGWDQGCPPNKPCGIPDAGLCINPLYCDCEDGECVGVSVIPDVTNTFYYVTSGEPVYFCLSKESFRCGTLYEECIPYAAHSSCANDDGCTGNVNSAVPLFAIIYKIPGTLPTPCTP